MSNKKINKSFDVLAFKDEVQAQIYEETKDMAAPELIVYFRDRARSGPLAEFWEKLQSQPNTSASVDA